MESTSRLDVGGVRSSKNKIRSTLFDAPIKSVESMTYEMSTKIAASSALERKGLREPFGNARAEDGQQVRHEMPSVIGLFRAHSRRQRAMCRAIVAVQQGFELLVPRLETVRRCPAPFFYTLQSIAQTRRLPKVHSSQTIIECYRLSKCTEERHSAQFHEPSAEQLFLHDFILH